MRRREKNKVEKLAQRYLPEPEWDDWMAFSKELELMVDKPAHPKAETDDRESNQWLINPNN